MDRQVKVIDDIMLDDEPLKSDDSKTCYWGAVEYIWEY